ncbi:hypothetical protein VXQ18_03440 [Brucella abortus]|nr:hypothetical protein [Brucella abortus]
MSRNQASALRIDISVISPICFLPIFTDRASGLQAIAIAGGAGVEGQ